MTVMVPGEDRGSAAMGSPAVGKLPQPALRGLFGEAQDAPGLDLDDEVAGGPDVRPAFRKQKVDFGGPAANALDPDKLGYRRFVLII